MPPSCSAETGDAAISAPSGSGVEQFVDDQFAAIWGRARLAAAARWPRKLRTLTLGDQHIGIVAGEPVLGHEPVLLLIQQFRQTGG